MQAVRELAERYSHQEIERCIEQQITGGKNDCHAGESPEETMNILSKASYVRRMVETGKAKDVTDAVRQMAGKIRSLQKNVKG